VGQRILPVAQRSALAVLVELQGAVVLRAEAEMATVTAAAGMVMVVETAALAEANYPILAMSAGIESNGKNGHAEILPTTVGNGISKAGKCRTNYIFVDCENVMVEEADVERLAGKQVKLVLVLGEHHKNLPLSLVKKLLEHADKVSLIETGRSGPNALDLVLALHLGAARHADPQGYFHIVSGDTDFDALIGHLNDNAASAKRRATFNEIPFSMIPDEPIQTSLNYSAQKLPDR
jgi:hypothetical protein